MRLILECHTAIRCYDEGAASLILAGMEKPSVNKTLLGMKVPQLTEQLNEATLRTDAFYQNLQVPIKECANPYSGQKILFMIRDPRDVVASMFTLKGWLEHYGGPVLDYKMAHDDAFKERYNSEIAHIRDSQYRNATRAALIWRYKTDALLDYMRLAYPVLPVWYQDLVVFPQKELLRVCAFLQIPWEPSLLQHSERSHLELEPSGLTIGKSDPNRTIDTRSIDHWKSILSEAEIETISLITAATSKVICGS